MKYACYNIETNEKNDEGGLVRFIIYPGKMKMFLIKDKPDKSKMAKYILNKYPIEKKTSQFRDNDCIWTENYNSAYNGSYNINMIEDSDSEEERQENDITNNINISDISDNKEDENIYNLSMRICIDDYKLQTPLSYSYINTKNIPNKYEYDFKNYKII